MSKIAHEEEIHAFNDKIISKHQFVCNLVIKKTTLHDDPDRIGDIVIEDIQFGFIHPPLENSITKEQEKEMCYHIGRQILDGMNFWG